MEPVAVIGLGNPGARYRATRHNLGFMVLAEVARRRALSFRPGPGPYEIGRTAAEADRDALLVAPSTFMNNSGEAAADVIGRYQVRPEEMLVVVDDFWLPLGRLRFRRRGSDGGHHGLASIIGALGSEECPRLRLGIGREQMPPKEAMADFVLAEFDEAERPLAADMILRAADAVEEFLLEGTVVPKNPPPAGDGGSA